MALTTLNTTIKYYYLGSTWSSVSVPLSYMRSVVWSRWTAYHISNALCFYLCITFPYTIFFARGLSLHLSSWHSVCCLKLIWNTILCTALLITSIKGYLPSHVFPMTSHVYSLMMFSPYCLVLQCHLCMS